MVPCSTSGARDQSKGGGREGWAAGVDGWSSVRLCFFLPPKNYLIFYYIEVLRVPVPYLNHYGL